MLLYIHKIYTYKYVNTYIYMMVTLAEFSFSLFFFFLFSEFSWWAIYFKCVAISTF